MKYYLNTGKNATVTSENIEICGHISMVVMLTSYTSQVCYVFYDNDGKRRYNLLPKWNYTPTTLKHVKQFLAMQGFGEMNKDELQYNPARWL